MLNFWNKDDRTKTLNQRNESLEAENEMLRDQIAETKGELADLEQTKNSKIRDLEDNRRRENEEIKHRLKMALEQDGIERKKFETECAREKEAAIAEVKDKYRDKMEEELRRQIEQSKELYGQILERLPNISARLKGQV